MSNHRELACALWLLACACRADAGTVTAPPAPAMMGQAGARHEFHDPCVDGALVAEQDARITSQPEEWRSPDGAVDLLLPRPVFEWMDQHLFREGHDAWHAVRKCFQRKVPGMPTSKANELCDKPKFVVAATQECAGADDGYQFLVAHRHMTQALRQAFPQHRELFEGFPEFPYAATDVPDAWRDRFGTWSDQVLDAARALDDIEHHLERFPTEGALGQFIQCGGGPDGLSSVHGAMHFKWVVKDSPVALGDQRTNVGNYMFWKLHGWIDAVWERWRIAKGLPSDDPELKTALIDQCREMHALAAEIGPAEDSTSPPEPLPKESGTFHERVRPILEDNCAACHAGANAEGGLVLGGAISSALIVRNLVGVASVRGGQFQRVLPGDPDRSWFYLKPADRAVTAGCTGTCNAQVMPPTGAVTLSQVQLEILRSWIADGAPGPNAM